jgi:hypothetical protein
VSPMRPAILLLACVACTPLPPPAPIPDASDASAFGAGDAPLAVADGPLTPCEAACAVLAAAGCPAGRAGDCARVLASVEAGRLIRTSSGASLTCQAVANAKTGNDIHALGLSCGP